MNPTFNRNLNFPQLDIVFTIAMTVLGIINQQVTVFYILYLFWFQELIRTFFDTYYVWKQEKIQESGFKIIGNLISSLFILVVYLVFIVVFFGFILSINKKDILLINLEVVLFRNWTFDLNLILFLVGYLFYRKMNPELPIEMGAFNRRHILLHISIILGGIMQMMVVQRLNVIAPWDSVVVIAPFLFLKAWLTKE